MDDSATADLSSHSRAQTDSESLLGFKIHRAEEVHELDELDRLLEQWAVKEGWGNVAGVVTTLRSLDSVVRLAGKLNGITVCTVTLINYSDSYSYLTSFVTSRDWRGKGYGNRLFDAALQYAENRTIGLLSIDYMEEYYAKKGFRTHDRCGFYELARPEGFQSSDGSCVVPALNISPSDLADFDQKYFPVRRQDFLQEWIRMPKSTAFAHVDQGKICGFGVVHRRESGGTGRVGPLYADSLEVASKLTRALLNTVSDLKSVRFEILEGNTNAKRFLTEFDMKQTETDALMFKNGPPPVFDASGIYAVTSGLMG